MPLDALTAARLARDGEKAGPVRHMCSGQHSVVDPAVPAEGLGPERLLARRPSRPGRLPGGRRPGVRRRRPTGSTAIDGCGVLDLRVPAARGRPCLRAARGPGGDRRRATRGARWPRRCTSSATRCWPTRRWSAGRRDRLDTSLMKAAPGRDRQQGRDGGVARARRSWPARARATADADRRRPGWRSRSRTATATTEGPGQRPSRRSRQAGVLDGQALRDAGSLPPAGRRSIPTAGSGPRRSPTSSSRRSAS